MIGLQKVFTPVTFLIGLGSFLPMSRAITAYSLSDPSLAGSVVAEVDGGGLYADGGPPPVPGQLLPLIAVVDEKVVRNDGGNLDFYYRFSDFQGAGTSPNWMEIVPINECSLSLGFIADGPGDISPAEGVSGRLQNFLGNPYTELQYAAFNVSSDAGSSTALSTKWLLVRTNARSYVTNATTIFFGDQPSDQYFGVGSAPPVGDRPASASLFFPGSARVCLSRCR